MNENIHATTYLSLLCRQCRKNRKLNESQGRGDGSEKWIILTAGNQTLNLQSALSFFSDYSDKLY
jgi:hypothetical protein